MENTFIREAQEKYGNNKIVPLASAGAGIATGSLEALLTMTSFDKATLDQLAFERVKAAITAVGGYDIKVNGFDIYDYSMGGENIKSFSPPEFFNKLDFSSVINTYNNLSDEIKLAIIEAAAAGIGIYALKKDKDWASLPLGISGGTGAAMGISASQYGYALRNLPVKIYGKSLFDYCTSYPGLTKDISVQVDKLLNAMKVFEIVGYTSGAVFAGLAAYSLIKSLRKKAPQISAYRSEMLD